jgi:outer membrane protein assembly factor BamB
MITSRHAREPRQAEAAIAFICWAFCLGVAGCSSPPTTQPTNSTSGEVTPGTVESPVSVLTRSYDNYRDGANTHEHRLTPANVPNLKYLFSLRLQGDDPCVEAQPLYVPGLKMNDGQVHDVVYLCSMSNRVWAFDANTGSAIWKNPISLGPEFLPSWSDGVDGKHINRSFGILSTPVIDLDAKLIYIVFWLSDSGTHQQRTLQLVALNLSDGQPAPGKPPLAISGSFNNQSGLEITLNPVQKQRAALLLVPLQGQLPNAPKMLYVAFTGSEQPPEDGNPQNANHGWVIAFDINQWKETASWISTPSSFGGGIWQASEGPAADDTGDIYFMTANGGYVNVPNKTDFNGKTDFAECFIRLHYSSTQPTPSLQVTQWFSPFRDAQRADLGALDYTDQDLGSSGPILIPDTKWILGAGKDGVGYLLNRDNMGNNIGGFNTQSVQPFFFTYDPNRANPQYATVTPTSGLDIKPGAGVKTHHQHSTPVYWKSDQFGPMLFTWGENGNLRAFSLDPTTGNTKLLAHGAEFASAALADPANQSVGGMPGGMIVLSANGGQNGIIWATAPIDGDANATLVSGVVRAYDATAFDGNNPDGVPRLKKLWETKGFIFSKFCIPLVVDGKLFVPTYNGQVDVYGVK